MRRRVCAVVFLTAVVGGEALGAAEMKPMLISDGLSGWVEEGSREVWLVENGVLTAQNPANFPNWLRSEKEYENFVLELEYQMPGWCEAGVLIHAPQFGRQSRSGLKIHLRHNDLDEGARSTGAIYDVLAPLARPVKEPGEWHSLRIESVWPRLRVRLNNETVQDVDMESVSQLRHRLRKGFIGFQDLGCEIKFRNIRLEELPGHEEWTDLFNGRNFDGWTTTGTARWSVEEGKIVAADGDGYMISDGTYSGYEFQVYVRTSSLANGGVFYRWQSRESRGYEAQIYNVLDTTNPTGSIYQVVPGTDPDSRDGQWFLMQIISDGPYSAILIDGKMVAEANSLEQPDRGRIALQMHSRGARIEFLKPRVKPLRGRSVP